MTKTYCAFPFQHQYVHMSGSVRLCCATMENVTDKKGNRVHMNNDSLQKIWNNDYMKDVRLKMKNGEVLKACTKCIDQEARGYKSMRQEDNEEKNINSVNTDGSIDTMPNSMELHFGNVCNLKCKMCGQDYSNQIGKELLEIGKNDVDFLSWVYKQSGNVNNWTNKDMDKFLNRVEVFLEDENILDVVFDTQPIQDETKGDEMTDIPSGAWEQEPPTDKQLKTFNDKVAQATDDGQTELVKKAKDFLASGNATKKNIFDWIDTDGDWTLKDPS